MGNFGETAAARNSIPGSITLASYPYATLARDHNAEFATAEPSDYLNYFGVAISYS